MIKKIWILALVSFFCCLGSLWSRYQVEKSNPYVELVLDYDSFSDLCSREGYPFDETLDKFKQLGVTTIAIPEMTLEKLRQQGRILVVSSENFPLFEKQMALPIKNFSESPPFSYILIKDQKIKEWLTPTLSQLYSPVQFQTFPQGIIIRGRWDDVGQINLGVFPDDAKAFADRGFFIAPRIENRNDSNFKKIDFLLTNISLIPKVSLLIFTGMENEVLGFDHSLKQVADFLRESPYQFGYIEAYEKSKIQKGSEELARMIPDRVVKVQTLLLPLFSRTDPEKEVETFVLGVKERNVRVLYFRPFSMSYSGKELLDSNEEFLRKLKVSLHNGGFQYGRARGFPFIHPSLLTTIAASTLVSCFVFLLLELFVDLKAQVFVFGLLLVIGIDLATYNRSIGEFWRLSLAFLSAFIFPAFGLIKLSPRGPTGLIKSVVALCKVTLITLIGGIAISSLLSDNLTMLGITGFRGVKATLFLPMLSVWVAWSYQQWDKPRVATLGEGFREFMKPFKRQVSFSHLLLLMLFAAGILLIAVRSGNAAPEGTVPQWEKTFRVVLEHTLAVRPRFKEFLLGVPCFLVSFLFGISNGWGVFLYLLGSLGQGDIMDSFAHLHTPIAVTLLRTLNGLWVGMVIGVFFRWIIVKSKIKNRIL